MSALALAVTTPAPQPPTPPKLELVHYDPLAAARSVWANTLGLTLTEKAILTVLLNHADANGHCYPSKTTLAAHTGVSEATVKRTLPKLMARGLLHRASATDLPPQRRPRTRVNIYRVDCAAIVAATTDQATMTRRAHLSVVPYPQPSGHSDPIAPQVPDPMPVDNPADWWEHWDIHNPDPINRVTMPPQSGHCDPRSTNDLQTNPPLPRIHRACTPGTSPTRGAGEKAGPPKPMPASALALGPTARTHLAPIIQACRDAGHPESAILQALEPPSNLVVRSPKHFYAARLETLLDTQPPKRVAPKPMCGRCDYRWITLPNGTHAHCPTCGPQHGKAAS